MPWRHYLLATLPLLIPHKLIYPFCNSAILCHHSVSQFLELVPVSRFLASKSFPTICLFQFRGFCRSLRLCTVFSLLNLLCKFLHFYSASFSSCNREFRCLFSSGLRFNLLQLVLVESQLL
jgi:hypothetical protein